MNLISCDRCGVVLDTDKITPPDIYDHDTQELIPGTYRYDIESMDDKPIIDCPACNTEIFHHNGED